MIKVNLAHLHTSIERRIIEDLRIDSVTAPTKQEVEAVRVVTCKMLQCTQLTYFEELGAITVKTQPNNHNRTKRIGKERNRGENVHPAKDLLEEKLVENISVI